MSTTTELTVIRSILWMGVTAGWKSGPTGKQLIDVGVHSGINPMKSGTVLKDPDGASWVLVEETPEQIQQAVAPDGHPVPEGPLAV
jgi:hypothetical protein